MKHSLSGRAAAALLCAALFGCDGSDNPQEAEAAGMQGPEVAKNSE